MDLAPTASFDDPPERSAPDPSAPDPGGGAGGGARQDEPAPTGGAGALSGRVLGPDDGPVEGAVLLALRRQRSREPVPPLRVEVDRLGRFEATVPAGDYDLFAEAPGHVRGNLKTARVRAGGAAEPVDVRLLRARSRLAGRVLGPGDAPLAGARVAAWDERRRAREGVTDATGAFALEGLPEGLYEVSAAAAGHVRGGAQVPVTEAHGGEVTLRLASGGRLEGRLTDPLGAPVASGSVFVYRQGERSAATNADADGRYALDGVPPGASELFVRSGDYELSARVAVDVVAGALVVRDVALALGRRISGRVVDAAGRPAAELIVIAREVGGDVEREGRTDAEGRYVVERLYPGVYRLSLGVDGADLGPRVAPTQVDVTTGPATCDLVRLAGASVEGEVVTAEGTPVVEAAVHAIEGGEDRGMTTTDAAGRFAFLDLAPGSYRLFVRDEGGRVGVVEMQVAAGDVVEGRRIVARAAARVRGRLLDPAGRPLAEVTLALRGVDGPVRRFARSDADGRFELGPLYDGDYELTAADDALQLAARRLEVPRLEVPARRVSVVRGVDVSCDVQARVPPG